MKKASIILIFLLVLLGIFLTGCSQTIVKYQCQDGSFKDSAEACSEVSCQTNCPELDCSVCPVKTEYKEKIVEKKVYVDKPVYKYQCFDGSFKDSINECSSFITDNPKVSSKCSQDAYKDVTSVELDLKWEDPDGVLLGFWSNEDYYKWYPSLNEGKIFGVDVYIKNIGCTKIKPKYNMLLIKNNNIIKEKEDSYFRSGTGLSWGTAGFGSDNKEYYPEDWSYSFETFEFMDGVKVTSPGTYIIRIIVKDELTGKIIGTGETSLTLG